MTRTTRADLTGVLHRVEDESRKAGILEPGEHLTLREGSAKAGRPYTLRRAPDHAFPPADGNGGDIGRTAREAEHTLRIMWATLRTVNRKRTS